MTRISKSEIQPDFSGKTIYEIFRMLDPYTRGHSRRISLMVPLIARHMGIAAPSELRRMRAGALYHDIGKALIPTDILNKPDPLTEEELSTIRKHPELSLRIIHILPDHEEISRIILHHHECWDGSGYPAGLKGLEICLGARICSVADTFDAMRTDRPYSRKKPFKLVHAEINRCSGSRYDPAVVEAFNGCARALDRIARGNK